MAGIPIYRTEILPAWIDYNGHLRDAYYALIVSLATDALMDRIGLEAGYRARTGSTLYTLELHLHFLQEIRSTDTVGVTVRIAGCDHKRIHAAFELGRAGEDAAATAEVMLMHVVQRDGHAKSAPFPPPVSKALAALVADSANLKAAGPGSRQMELPPPRGVP